MSGWPPIPTIRRWSACAAMPASSTAHAKYQRLLDIAPSPANALEFCIGSLQEMLDGDVYETTRHFARLGAIAYVHFRNVRGKVPIMSRPSSTTAMSTWRKSFGSCATRASTG
jgi:hypothetical protein